VQFLLENGLLIMLALVSGAMLLKPMLGQGAGSVTAAEAVRLFNREKGVLVDVREPAEFTGGHAVGAKNIPLAGLEEQSKGLPSNKALPVVLVCATGARSQKAAAQLRKSGFEKAVSLAGGMRAWQEANLPIEKA
jgi:rhodanese-related sulfurtransferase